MVIWRFPEIGEPPVMIHLSHDDHPNFHLIRWWDMKFPSDNGSRCYIPTVRFDKCEGLIMCDHGCMLYMITFMFDINGISADMFSDGYESLWM